MTQHILNIRIQKV